MDAIAGMTGLTGILFVAQAVADSPRTWQQAFISQGPMGAVCLACILALVWVYRDKEKSSQIHHAERDKREDKLQALIEAHTRTATEQAEAIHAVTEALQAVNKGIAYCQMKSGKGHP
jgi:hypothetical protein